MTARWKSLSGMLNLSDLLKSCGKKSSNTRQVRRRPSPLALAVQMEILEQRLMMTAVSWNTDADGFWDDASNWSTGQVPNAGDDVTIDRGAAHPTITIRDTRSVNSIVDHDSLVVASGTFQVNTSTQIDDGSLTLAAGAEIDAFGTMSITNTANFDWQGGTLFSQGLTNAGAITVSAAADVRLSGSFTNNATIVQTSAGNVLFDGNTKLVNAAGAVYNFESDAGLGLSGIGGGFSPFFQNDGTLRKSAGTGVSTVTGVAVNSSATGVFDIRAGQLDLAGNGSWTGATIDAAAGSVFEVSGTVDITGSYSGSGAGEFELTGRINTTPDGATINFPAGYFQWTSGIIFGQGTGLINAGSLSIAPTASVRLAGLLTNNGTIVQAGAGTLTFDGNTEILNNSGALYDVQGNGGIASSGFTGGFAPFLQNNGTLRKSSGTGTSTVADVAVNSSNTGVFDILAGRYRVATHSNLAGGTFAGGAAGVMELSGSVVVTGTLTGSGTGQLQLTGDLDTIGQAATLNFPKGYFQWLSGSINGSGPGLTNAGFLDVAGAADKTVLGKLIDTGTIQHTGLGNLLLDTGSTVQISSTGLYDFQSDGGWGSASLNGGGQPFFEVQGMVRKSGGTGTTLLSGGGNPFRLDLEGGTIDVESGTVNLADGGFWQGGELDAATGSVLQLTDNGIAVTGSFTGSGGGRIELNTSVASTDFGVAGAHATFNFPPSLLHWQSGTIGSGGSASTVGSGTTLVNTGFMVLDGAGSKGINGTGLINAGTIVNAGPGAFSLDSSTLTNLPGAVFEEQGDAPFTGTDGAGNPGHFINSGTFKKTSGTGTVNYTGLFDNPSTGVIEMDSGHMQFSRGGTLAGTNIQVGAGAILELTGNGFFEMTGTYTGTGPGTILFNSKMDGPDPGDPARLNFPQGMFQINAGINQGFFGTIINDGWINDTSTAAVYMRANFTNNGTFIQSGTADLQLNANTHFTNNGLYDLQSDASLVVPSDGSGGSMLFTNNGVFQKSGGTGTSAFRHAASGNEFHLENPGTIDVKSGTLSINDSIAQRSGTTLTGGTWTVENSATLTMAGSGNVTINQANVTLSGPTASFPNLNALTSNQGQLTLAGGADLTTTGNLSNSGSVTLGAGSVLTVTGNYTQTGGTSSLNEIIGGRPASGLAGKLIVTGQAALAGRLVFSHADGFGPTLGDQYQVLQYASKTGSFGLIAGLSPFFSVDVQAAQTLLTSIGAGVNTSLLSVIPPANAVVGQNVSIPFTVQNNDATAITGDWTDSVYLSSDGTLSADDVLLARVPHSGGIGANSSYTGTANGILPDVIDGDYHVIVVADSSGVIADTNRTDNTLASASVIHVTVPTLTFGSPTTATITDNQDKLYRVDIASNDDVILSGTFAVPYEAEFLVGYGRVPTTGSFDFAATNLADLNRQIVISGPQVGPYYILIAGREGAATPQNFTLTARQPGFEVRSIGPTHGSNQGQTTLTISGSGFTPSSTATLIAPDNSGRSASSIVYVDANTLYATFDLHNLAAASGYDVRVENGVQTATANDVFTVNSGASAAVQVSVSTPQFLRGGTTGTVTIDYFNPGETDIPAPLLRLASDNARFAMPGSSTFTDDSILLLGINANGPAGVLPAGSHQSITLQFQPKVTGPHVTSEFDVAVAAPALVIDWASLKADLRPSNVTTDAWNAIYANFLNAVGTTQGDLQKVLDGAATYLSSLGETTSDPNELLSLVMQDAGAYGQIADRYRSGAFGRGQADPTTIQLTADISGVISINYGGFVRTFTRQANGTFQGLPGDFATLSQVNGNYQLRETDGTQYVFLSNGLVNYVQAIDGNRTTFGYSNGKLVTQTNSIGDTITYAYNGQGRVSQVTDAVGRVTSFAYDSSGEHLLSITNAAGTTTYSYITGQGAAREHAVQSITNPDGTHLYFTYDAQGRLSTTSHDGGQGTLTYTYNGLGKTTITDADGQQAVASTDAFDQIARVQTPLNGVVSFSYDQNRNLSQYTVSGTATTDITRDALGNQTQTVDPLGNVVSSQYTQNLNQLQNVTGPNGNSVVSFAYDSHGNLITQTTADQAASHYLYDSRGNLTQKTDAVGNVTKYTYDSKNLLTHVVYQDGSTVDYGYDAHRNLTTITDASGVIAQTYDAADRLTSVAYPDGRSLHYTYDAGGRISQILTQDGFATNYHYDSAGRLSSTTDASGNTTVAYQYDAVSRLSRRTLGNGEYTTYAYNGRSQVTSLTNHAADGTVESQYVYTYDAQGRPLTMTTDAGTTTYGFDATQQLTSVTLPDGRVIHYQYDAAGNRIVVNDAGTQTAYTTNSANQYTDVGATHYTYDANGNLTTKTDGTGTTTYTYDAHNRLVGIVSPTDTWADEYDALGNLVAVVHNGQRTEYLVDPLGISSVVGEYDGTGSLVAHYSQGNDVSSRVDASGASEYYQYDANGNTTSLSDASGGVLDSYSYLPFGGQLTSTGTTPNPFTFVGAAGIMDQGQGLYYMRNRWYDPATGRFTSPDPSGLLGGDANLYRYTGNRVIDVSDPTGLATPIGGGGNRSRAPSRGGGANKVPPVGNGPPKPGDQPPEEPGGEPGGDGPGGDGPGGNGPGGNGPQVVQEAEEVEEIATGTTDSFVASAETAEGAGTLSAEAAGGTGVGAILLFEGVVVFGATRAVSHATGLDDVVADSLEHKYFDYRDKDPFSNLNLSDSYRRKIQDSLDSGHTWDESFGGIRDRGKGQQIFSGDPNDLLGPPPFVTNDQSLPYTIDFENIPDASAPAQSVVITETLDSDLDLSTFQLGNIGFGSTAINVPAGLTSFSTKVSLPAANDIGGAPLNVDVTADLNFLTRVVTWTFTTLDPLTGDVPANPLAGFLPANVVDPEGQGFVNYTVRPNAGLHTGAAIDSQATVVFDTNAPITTPHITTTIDDGAPTSAVTALSPTQDFPSFPVSWSGTDDAAGPAGSGIAFYDVYVSDNGGAFVPFLLGTTLTTAVFAGQVDHTYSFYSVATDNVGLQQAAPVSGQAATQVLDVLFDFGDAPDPVFGTAGSYPTLLAHDGARHKLGSGLFLGTGVDAEVDGQPTTTANGDDINGPTDDEDGVVFLNLVRGTTGSATVTASLAGKLDAWIDFNHDGDWSDPGEQIATSLSLNAGSNTVSFAIPAGAVAGNTYARFRLSSAGGLSVTGAAADGEVEDYQVQIAAPLLTQDGGAVTWTNKQPPATVLPQVTVPFSDLANGTLSISVNAVGTKKKSLDIFTFPSAAGLGTTSGAIYANGHITITVQLNGPVTSSAIQAFLRGITFATKGKGLHTESRSMTVTLSNSTHVSNTITQTIHVIKKAPHVKHPK